MTASTSASPHKSSVTCSNLALVGLILLGFALAPLLTAGLNRPLITSLTSASARTLELFLLAGLLALPVGGSLLLGRRPGRGSLKRLGLSLGLAAIYALVAIALRAAAGDSPPLEAGLRLLSLSLVAVGGGILALPAADIPRRLTVSTIGLQIPSLSSLALGSGLAGVLTLGWPLTGALGDNWTSLGLVFKGLALALPEELVFRGVILGLLIHGREAQKGLTTALSLLIYLAFIPTQILPNTDWEALGLIFVLVPMALFTTQLRYLTGNVWVGVLVAWFYRTIPILFTDPRDEILEPTQWLAGGGMVAGAMLLALGVWITRRPAAARPPRFGIVRSGLALALAGVVWAGWISAWVFAGAPGFHNDGFLIVMEQQADLSAAYAIADPVQRRAYVYETLVKTAEETQSPIWVRLDERGYTYRPYYLINMIEVYGHHRQRGQFADLPGVAYVMYNPNVRPYPSHTALGTLPAPPESGIEWNIRQVNADDVWAMGYRGQGVVVGGQDTGYDWDHPALRDSYRGWDPEAGQAIHDYNWHDAWDDTPAPHDDGDHGTHTMGIVLGRAGQQNQIGMAPEAKWIGCRNMRRGIGNPASYTECTEFLLAPYPLGGDSFRDGDVSRAADVINNSWGCPDYEGCEDETLRPALEAMRAAGIMMVVSAGNEGPACMTANEPPARYAAAFAVGATDRSGTVTAFSSRGPVSEPAERDSLLKPDVVAPGDEIRSSVSGGEYGLASGTSMAGPHVTGLAALLWSARPDLRGDVQTTEEIIRQTAIATPVSTSCVTVPQPPAGDLLTQIAGFMDAQVCACGGVTGVPNNVYGWGQIDALRAVEMALERP